MPQQTNAHHLDRRARTIVESLNGTWRQNKGMCCCPAHDDRTPSLSVTLGRKAILFHCFAGCSNEEVIAALDRQGVRSRDLFNGSGAVSADRPEKRAFNSNARRLWHSATAISDSPAEGYLAKRGILRASDQLRYLERTPLGPRGAVQFLPAMLAAVTSDIGVIAVHRTFLDAPSAKLAAFDRPKRALGSLGCGAVRLAPPAAGQLTERVAPGVVYTTFHHPATQANVVTTEFSDWATNCPEYKVTAVQVLPSNGPTDWQESYEALSRRSRRITPAVAAE